MKINIFWFRRDLRMDDNRALTEALNEGVPVLPLFIFDTNILEELASDDARVNFIYQRISLINDELGKEGSSVHVLTGDPADVWKKLIVSFDINSVYCSADYEPYAIRRDDLVGALLKERGIRLVKIRDQVIFGGDDIMKPDGRPYTVFTPYKRAWLKKFAPETLLEIKNRNQPRKFLALSQTFPSIETVGFSKSSLKIKPYDLSVIRDYEKHRDIPSADRTSHLSPHLRFGTVSIREIVRKAMDENASFLSELIWREFFMQILFHFPGVVTDNFKPAYDSIDWRNDTAEYERWCAGETGYPIVDAGMRQLNESGYMHNRVRMITAGFLCKHLLIDWRWGEAYFAQKLLDYDLSSNNGNWQWAAGTGCDAAPYFRVFNPEIQQKKFDHRNEYVRKWVPEFDKPSYSKKIVEHDFARQRAIETYKAGLRIKI